MSRSADAGSRPARPDRQRIAFFAALAVVLIAILLLGWWIYDSTFGESHDLRHLRDQRIALATHVETEALRVKRMPFVTSLCFDAGGCAFIGTEDNGVFRADPSHLDQIEFTQFTTADGLGDDNAYALACDRKGRVWCGHLNHGVSVFNGNRFQNYEVIGGLSRRGTLNGPLGERVFAIKVCPIDGDVWIATNCGLTRYSESKDTWSDFTRAGSGEPGRTGSGEPGRTGSGEPGRTDGMPFDQASAIAFDADGNLYVATQCDGIAIAARADDYRHWDVVPGEPRMPLSASGQGLPSNLINDLLVGPDGSVYAATVNGLGISRDRGKHWSYIRGRDWRERIKGLEESPGAKGTNDAAILGEDRCTCLALDSGGRLWVGHRAVTYDVLDARKLTRAGDVPKGPSFDGWPVRAILPIQGTSSALIGVTGDGLVVSPGGAKAAVPAPLNRDPPALPSVAKPPTDEELDAATQRVRSLPKAPAGQVAAYLGADWSTLGDWVGHYGRQYATICGLRGNYSESEEYQVSRMTGGHVKDEYRGGYYFVYGGHGTSPRWLFDPKTSQRVIGEWNDGTFNEGLYSFEWEGPDLWVSATIPSGIHRVSLYFLNKDGHGQHQIRRDYQIEVKQSDGDVDEAQGTPTLARARVMDFWGGVYHQFQLRGPGKFWFAIRRQASNVTTVSGVFIDRLTELTGDESTSAALPGMGEVVYEPPAIADNPQNTTSRVLKARQLWDALDSALAREGIATIEKPLRILAYRGAAAGGADDALLANWRWKLHMPNHEDRKRFDAVMKEAQPRK